VQGGGRQGARRFIVFVALAAVTVAASACGSDATASAPPTKISTVVEKTESVGTARLEGHSINTFKHQKPSVATYTGEIDFTHDQSALVGHTRRNGRMHEFQSRSIGNALYTSPADTMVEPPKQNSRLVVDTDGKTWSRFPYFGDAGVFGLEDVGNAGRLLRSLDRAHANGEVLGHEAVRRVATEHVRFTLPTPDPPKQVAALSYAGTDVQTMDLWIDARQHLRKMRWVREG
jgi:hypothetical protein